MACTQYFQHWPEARRCCLKRSHKDRTPLRVLWCLITQVQLGDRSFTCESHRVAVNRVSLRIPQCRHPRGPAPLLPLSRTRALTCRSSRRQRVVRSHSDKHQTTPPTSSQLPHTGSPTDTPHTPRARPVLSLSSLPKVLSSRCRRSVINCPKGLCAGGRHRGANSLEDSKTWRTQLSWSLHLKHGCWSLHSKHGFWSLHSKHGFWSLHSKHETAWSSKGIEFGLSSTSLFASTRPAVACQEQRVERCRRLTWNGFEPSRFGTGACAESRSSLGKCLEKRTPKCVGLPGWFLHSQWR